MYHFVNFADLQRLGADCKKNRDKNCFVIFNQSVEEYIYMMYIKYQGLA